MQNVSLKHRANENIHNLIFDCISRRNVGNLRVHLGAGHSTVSVSLLRKL